MHTKHKYGGLGVPDVVNIYVECMTPTWLAGAHSHVPAVRAAYMSRISTQANAAIAVSLASSISEQRSSSMNRLFSLFCMGIRIYKGHAPLELWCHTSTPRPNEDPSEITCKDWTNPDAKWVEQVARHLVRTPGHHTYPPSKSGQYDLRLRSQLMLPPEGTIFVLIPTTPLTRADPPHARPVPIHRLVEQLPVISHAYLAFVSLPEAIFHANHTVRYPVSIRAVGSDTTPTRF